MKWVTRANVKVDRVACPWLIRTFVDRGAEFPFVPVGEVEAVARKSGAIPYDVAGVHFTHDGSQWTLRFDEKGGKARDIPVQHTLERLLRESAPDRRHGSVARPWRSFSEGLAA